MPITQQHIQEDLSRSYVQAIAAKAGVTLSLQGRNHDYKVDGTFHQVSCIDNKLVESGFNLDFQLKATINAIYDYTSIKYDLDAATYNAHVKRNNNANAASIVLIILALPKDSDTWLSLSEEELVLKKCCYWIFLKGLKASNLIRKRIKIPRCNQLTPRQVTQFLDKLTAGEVL